MKHASAIMRPNRARQTHMPGAHPVGGGAAEMKKGR